MTTEESKYSLEDSRKLLAWFLEMQNLQAKLAKIQEHLLSAKDYIDATECIQPCDSYGVCFKCSIEGDILIALREYREETK